MVNYMLKLHIGCGGVYFPGWVNVDMDSPKADLRHDMRTALPYGEGTADFVYNEHFVEHLTVAEGLTVLKDFHRVLKAGGVLRIATIDLDHIVCRYLFFWKKQNWIKTYGQQFYPIAKKAVQLIPALDSYSSAQLEFQTLVTKKEETTERLKGIKVDITGSILTSGLLVIKCGDEELKFGCRPQSPKDHIDISLVYIASQGLKIITD